MPKKPAPVCPLSFDADDATVLRQCIDYYHDTLKRHPEGLDFLKRRGIDHPDAIDTFRLGFANRTLGLTLPVKQLKNGAAIRAQLERIGLYRSSGHEHLNGSLVVPVFDAAGRVLQAYGRKVHDNLRAGTPKHLMLPGELRGVWNREAITAEGEAILAGGLIDALSWWCTGHRRVTASFGLAGYTDELQAALSTLSRVILAFPRTPDGERASEAIAAKLAASGVEVFAVAFPPGLDANDCLLKLPGGAEALGTLLRRAEWIDRVPSVVLPIPEPPSVPVAPPAPDEGALVV